MKLPVKFATVQIQQELPDLARHPHVLVLGNKYMCLKLSMAIRGRSSLDL